MVAAKAIDSSWSEYFFKNTFGSGHDSGWQSSRVYEDTGLKPGTSYTYTVTARDYSRARNTAASSKPVSVSTRPRDGSRPQPASMKMKRVPLATSPSTIYMVAAAASDASGVEYYWRKYCDSLCCPVRKCFVLDRTF